MKNWKKPDEPVWFYRLDEIVYLMLMSDGDAPPLTLDYLKRHSQKSFLYCPELCIRKQSGSDIFMEIDLNCIANIRVEFEAIQRVSPSPRPHP